MPITLLNRLEASLQSEAPPRPFGSAGTRRYGPALEGDANFRLLSEMVWRKAPGAPMSTLGLVHKSVRALNVISADASDAMDQLGATMAVRAERLPDKRDVASCPRRMRKR